MAMLTSCTGSAESSPTSLTATPQTAAATTLLVEGSAVDSSAPTEPTDPPAPSLPERIVALSEEFLLADLIALGVRPVASTSNELNGFVGLEPAVTNGITPIFSPEFGLESLATLRPDLIIVYQSYLDIGVVSAEDLAGIAELVVVDESTNWRAQFIATADALGLRSVADEVLVEVDAEFARATTVLTGKEVSALSVSPGPLIRAYTDQRTQLTDVLVDAGVVLVPGSGTSGTDDNGRITLSLEQLELLSADILLLLQSDVVPGEAEALADVKSSPLWAALPAVRGGHVVTLDRLAYPGATGAARFVTDLAAALAE